MVKTIRILYYLMLGYMLLVFVLCCIGLMSFGYGLGDGFMLIFLLIVIGLLALFIRPIRKMESLNVAQFIALGLLMFVPCIFLTYKVTYDRGPEHEWDGHILWIRSDINYNKTSKMGLVYSIDDIPLRNLVGNEKYKFSIRNGELEGTFDVLISNESHLVEIADSFRICPECDSLHITIDDISKKLDYYDNAGKIYLMPDSGRVCYLKICNADSQH